jgi:hypothetical protein
MTVATRAIIAAALIVPLLAASPLPAFAAPHHTATSRAHAPTRITIYPARIDYSRFINPWNGRFCHDDGWAVTCVPPPLSVRGVACSYAWPFPACRYF